MAIVLAAFLALTFIIIATKAMTVGMTHDQSVLSEWNAWLTFAKYFAGALLLFGFGWLVGRYGHTDHVNERESE